MKNLKYYFFIFLFILFNRVSFSEEKNNFIDYEKHKKKLIQKKLLLNSFENCEEYINESSVELFLNCKTDKQKID